MGWLGRAESRAVARQVLVLRAWVRRALGCVRAVSAVVLRIAAWCR